MQTAEPPILSYDATPRDVCTIGENLPDGKKRLDSRPLRGYNIYALGVWRSLVSRLVRVQEAVGSNPATPTMKET